MNILALTFEQLATEFSQRYNKGKFHARALYREVYKNGTRDFSQVPELAASPALALQLKNDIRLPTCHVVASEESQVIKFATSLYDNFIIESVIIPSKRGRTTLCISSQVGCKMGCAFCATGVAGFVRNLTTEEIVLQVYTAQFTFNRTIDNIVFMGMGEPFDNFDNMLQAIRVISDQRGFNIALRHITVSTAGHADGIKRLGALQMPGLRLAVSINAPDDELRSSLMPINKRYPLTALKQALSLLPLRRDSTIFIEYVLIAGVNDSLAMADKLAHYLHGLRVRINLIPYNASSSLPFTTPSAASIEQFRLRLVQEKLFVRLRSSRGNEIKAACGQLRASLTHKDDYL